MAGRVVLYNDVIYTLKRPDSKRPQALKSRVACALAEWKPHCGRLGQPMMKGLISSIMSSQLSE